MTRNHARELFDALYGFETERQKARLDQHEAFLAPLRRVVALQASDGLEDAS